jgi:hypothetical protein
MAYNLKATASNFPYMAYDFNYMAFNFKAMAYNLKTMAYGLKFTPLFLEKMNRDASMTKQTHKINQTAARV